MSAKKRPRQKHIPQRTCVGCREINAKRELVRIVRQPEGVAIDPTGKLSGRGAYLHQLRSCWERGIQGSLARALKTELTAEDIRLLREYAATLPEGQPQSVEAGSGSQTM